MEAEGYNSLRGTSAMQEPSRNEQEMLVLGVGTAKRKFGQRAEVLFHSALQVKEMHSSLGLLFLCDFNEIHALCIFMLQKSYLCMKIVDEEEGISKC